MIRRYKVKKKFNNLDLKYKSFLVNLLINKVLKSGKKVLAKKLVYSTLSIIQLKTKKNPLLILEEAIKKLIPKFQIERPSKELKKKFLFVNTMPKYKGLMLSLRWLIQSAKKGSSNKFIIKLSNEIINTWRGHGNSLIKKYQLYSRIKSLKQPSDLSKNI